MNSSPNHPDDRRADEAEPRAERHLPDPQPSTPEQEPGNTWDTPDAERPPRRQEGTVSDPDFPFSAAGTGPAV
jgi:hypothetical protein